MGFDSIWIIAQATSGDAATSGSNNELIDWFTVAAQIVNFLILVALLRYFLYGRIIAAMDRRQEAIASRWDEAERRQQRAEEEAESHRQKHRALDEQRDAMLKEAREQADQRRDELIARAREEAEQLRDRWRASIRQEHDAFLDELRRRAAEGTCAIARRALTDLADADLERQVIRTFLDRLESLDGSHRDELRESIRGSDHAPIVRSAFDLPDDLGETIIRRVREHLGDDTIALRFETDSRLICGIALSAEGRKVAWDLDDYLEDLQSELAGMLRREATGEEEDRETAQARDDSESKSEVDRERDKEGKSKERSKPTAKTQANASEEKR